MHLVEGAWLGGYCRSEEEMDFSLSQSGSDRGGTYDL